jgi:xylose dehydrogenase (NAD/NADP)
MRLGLLSTARINDAILAGAAASDLVEVVAVGSRDGARADAYARERGIERAHGSYDALLGDEEVDAVYISLPNGLHHEWTMRSLAAGKHVLCEKPYSRHPAEVEEAYDLAEGTGLVVMEAFQYRHHPQTVRMKAMVGEGAIGRLRVLRSSFAFALQDLSDIRARPELDGGALMDVGCYCISEARLLAGEPERCVGDQVVGPTGVDMFFYGTLSFPNDVVGQFDCSFALPYFRRFEVVGEDATLVVRLGRRGWGLELRREDGVTPIETPTADAYRLELENLAAAASGEAEPRLGRADALGQAKTIAALYRSAAEGRPIALDEL